MLNLNSSLPEGWTANIVIIYQSSNIYWRGAPVYTSPAPYLQPEQAAPERGCGIGNACFEPGRASEWGSEGVIGLRNAKIDPARASGSACGLRKPRFDPGMALERGAGGVIGLRNAEIEPERPSGRANGIGNARFGPEKPSKWGAWWLFGLRKTSFDPAIRVEPSGAEGRRGAEVMFG